MIIRICDLDILKKWRFLSRYEEMQQAMVDKDIDTLNKIVKDWTMYTHMSWKRQTKEEYFSDIKNGRLDYQDYT